MIKHCVILFSDGDKYSDYRDFKQGLTNLNKHAGGIRKIFHEIF